MCVLIKLSNFPSPCSNHCSVALWKGGGGAVSNAVVLAVIKSVEESYREVANMAMTKFFKYSFSACYPIENESQTILGGKGQFHGKGQSLGKCMDEQDVKTYIP